MSDCVPSTVCYVDNAQALERLVDHCRRALRVAIDTEADSLHHYFEKVCLIQVSLHDAPIAPDAGADVLDASQTHYIIDPLAGVDLSDFFHAIKEKPLILHGADYDLRMLGVFHDFQPRLLPFDTMLAAQLLGFEHLGLAAMTERYFGVELPKTGQKYDWSHRPLPQAKLDYAINDTRYLGILAARLEAELRAKDRLEWHGEVCRRMVETSTQIAPRDPDREWRVKGATKLEGRPLTILRELWHWREEQARQVDRPTFMIVGNAMLVTLAEWGDSHAGADLGKNGPKLPRNLRGSRLTTLRQAIDAGRDLPKSQWPSNNHKPRERNNSMGRPDEALVKTLQKERDLVAKKLEMPPSVLAPKATLQAIVVNRPSDAETMIETSRMYRWQANLLADAFLKVLEKAK